MDPVVTAPVLLEPGSKSPGAGELADGQGRECYDCEGMVFPGIACEGAGGKSEAYRLLRTPSRRRSDFAGLMRS